MALSLIVIDAHKTQTNPISLVASLSSQFGSSPRALSVQSSMAQHAPLEHGILFHNVLPSHANKNLNHLQAEVQASQSLFQVNEPRMSLYAQDTNFLDEIPPSAGPQWTSLYDTGSKFQSKRDGRRHSKIGGKKHLSLIEATKRMDKRWKPTGCHFEKNEASTMQERLSNALSVSVDPSSRREFLLSIEPDLKYLRQAIRSSRNETDFPEEDVKCVLNFIDAYGERLQCPNSVDKLRNFPNLQKKLIALKETRTSDSYEELKSTIQTSTEKMQESHNTTVKNGQEHQNMEEQIKDLINISTKIYENLDKLDNTTKGSTAFTGTTTVLPRSTEISGTTTVLPRTTSSVPAPDTHPVHGFEEPSNMNPDSHKHPYHLMMQEWYPNCVQPIYQAESMAHRLASALTSADRLDILYFLSHYLVAQDVKVVTEVIEASRGQPGISENDVNCVLKLINPTRALEGTCTDTEMKLAKFPNIHKKVLDYMKSPAATEFVIERGVYALECAWHRTIAKGGHSTSMMWRAFRDVIISGANSKAIAIFFELHKQDLADLVISATKLAHEISGRNWGNVKEILEY